jgi:C4-dicarboxylate transporter DctM subunit
MDPIQIAGVVILALFAFVLLGFPIAFSLAGLSVLGIFLVTGRFDIAISILASTSFEALRNYTFAVVPLFMLMGAFLSNSEMAKDLFKFANHFLRKIPAGLGVATVIANAIFAAITGVAIASAAVFSKVSTPQMLRHNYSKAFATGSVAGTSTLGMLIPPSLMFIMYGMLAEVAIGKLFMAGFVPGIILAAMFSAGVVLLAIYKPSFVFDTSKKKSWKDTKNETENIDISDGGENIAVLTIRVIPILLLIILVLGGIWGGIFTPTEASAVGSLGALVIGFTMGGLGWEGFKKALLDTASGTASVLFLLMSAIMYSRMLAISGVLRWVTNWVGGLDVSSYVILFIFLGVTLLMGCVLDSISILLLLVPLVVPIMKTLGFDLIWFGVVLVLTIHMGLLTPPFGMSVFAVKTAIDIDVSVQTIFYGSMPFLIIMIPHLFLIIAFPILSTWLPSLM